MKMEHHYLAKYLPVVKRGRLYQLELKVGVQSFLVGFGSSKAEAAWLQRQLGNALHVMIEEVKQGPEPRYRCPKCGQRRTIKACFTCEHSWT